MGAPVAAPVSYFGEALPLTEGAGEARCIPVAPMPIPPFGNLLNIASTEGSAAITASCMAFI